MFESCQAYATHNIVGNGTRLNQSGSNEPTYRVSRKTNESVTLLDEGWSILIKRTKDGKLSSVRNWTDPLTKKGQ